MSLTAHLQECLAELDQRCAADAEYRSIFSTGSKVPLRRGETWRGRLQEWIAYAQRCDAQRRATHNTTQA